MWGTSGYTSNSSEAASSFFPSLIVTEIMECRIPSNTESHANEMLLPANTNAIPQKRIAGYDLSSAVRRKTKVVTNSVTRACDACKTKKAKCSGDQPCATCSRRGLSCQYESAYSRGTPPIPRPSGSFKSQRPIDTPDHSTNQPIYQELMLNNLLEQAELHHTHTASMRTTVESPEPPEPPPLENPEVSEPLETVQLLASGRGSPGLEVAGQYSDPTSGLSFLHRAWRRISNKDSSQVMASHLGSTEENQSLTSTGDKPLQRLEKLQMPSLSRGRNLLELYFDVCIATYRILHKPSVEGWCVTVLTNDVSHQSLSDGVGNARTAVVLSVLAIASFHEEKTRDSGVSPGINSDAVQSQSDELFCVSMRLSEEETGYPRLESAQSRLIQVLYLLMSSRFNQAWYTFGLALQIISALGLHRRDDRKRIPSAERRDYVEEQCKRRTFWVAYTLDKYLGVIFGRPRHYHDDDIDQDFPDSVHDEGMLSSGPQTGGTDDDCHIDSLIFHAKLAQIAEKISREVYSIKDIPDHDRLAASHRLGAELRQWKASLPPLLGAVNPNSLIASYRRQAIALKLSYCHAVMLAHRPFLLKNALRNNEDLQALAKESLAECISAAQSVLEAVDRMAQDGRLFHAFWWTHYVCFCALVIVYVWAIQESNNESTLNERRKILDQAERCLSHLAQATASNSPSRKYSIILQELRAEAKRKTARPCREQSIAPPALAVNTASVFGSMHNATQINNDPMQKTWQPLFGSPIDTATPGLQNFLDDWQTTDWLHLDSSAFGPFPDFDTLHTQVFADMLPRTLEGFDISSNVT